MPRRGPNWPSGPGRWTPACPTRCALSSRACSPPPSGAGARRTLRPGALRGRRPATTLPPGGLRRRPSPQEQLNAATHGQPGGGPAPGRAGVARRLHHRPGPAGRLQGLPRRRDDHLRPCRRKAFLGVAGRAHRSVRGQRGRGRARVGRHSSRPARRLLTAHNEIHVAYERSYDHTGEGFHQFFDPEDGREYLYTQFEPYSAHRLFPCFDQPDLKATYRVSVSAPAEWAVVSAGAELELPGPARRTHPAPLRRDGALQHLPHLGGGRGLPGVHEQHGAIRLGSSAAPLCFLSWTPAECSRSRSRASTSTRTSRPPCPFGKYDQHFVPEFNCGGMENVAAVGYNELVVFRDPPTEDEVSPPGRS